MCIGLCVGSLGVQCNVDWVGLCQLGCAMLLGFGFDQLGCAMKCGLDWVMLVGMCSVIWIGLGCVSWDVQCNVDWIGLCQFECAV